jgi:hypothetical protein
VRVTELVSEAGELSYDRLAVAQNAFERRFRVLAGCKLQLLLRQMIQPREIVIIPVLRSIALFDDMLADGLQKRLRAVMAPSGSHDRRSRAFCHASWIPASSNEAIVSEISSSAATPSRLNLDTILEWV